jgi:hypothetical protein
MKAEGEMTGPRPAGQRWTLADDDVLRGLLASGMKRRLIAQKMKRSIGAQRSAAIDGRMTSGFPSSPCSSARLAAPGRRSSAERGLISARFGQF